ncbi:hypothetical protein BQ8482_110179 [Mesorhizobium delmotii]|uniref:Uncharacterized protein n=1 Tax=Mesorhizobium delmotii TaxID=1631247 RepID=A0A2P9AAV2_9HYPH|nr:hypothetical protein BQ8482_110179 [Mesorhizobium delmotii]
MAIAISDGSFVRTPVIQRFAHDPLLATPSTTFATAEG